MNTFVEGELYFGFANTAPTRNLWVNQRKNAVSETKRGYAVFCLHHGFAKNGIWLMSQMFGIRIQNQRRQSLVVLKRVNV